jgi:hypothetical protein
MSVSSIDFLRYDILKERSVWLVLWSLYLTYLFSCVLLVMEWCALFVWLVQKERF